MSLSLAKKRRKNDTRCSGANDTNPNEEDEPTTSKRAKRHEISSAISQVADNGDYLRRCGKILRMHLVNFMCHANLTIEFTKNINFLVGSNGSGKSAILAALVLGLGGKAKATNRSGSMKQFIKTGEASAKIEITISNDGPQGFEPDVYGDEITVIRSLTQSSGSTFQIKSAFGTIISRKVDDLNRILLYHNIQVDNTIFVLNQDSAREFLKELEPSKNYKVFLKATQLEMIMDKLNDCLHCHKEQKYNLKCYQKDIENAQQEVKKLKDKLTQLMSVKKLSDVIKQREAELLWLKVNDLENEVQEVLGKIAKLDERKMQLTNKVQNKGEQEAKLNQELNKYKSEIVEKTSAYNEKNTKCMEVKTLLTKLQTRWSEIKGIMDSLKKRKRHYEAEIGDIQTHINDRSKQNIGDIAETRQRNEETLQQLKASKEENKVIIENAKRDLNLFLNNKMQKEEEIRKMQSTRSNINDNINRINQNISSVKNTSKDKLSLYGDHIPMLRAEIVNYMKAGKFSEMPRGPIGHYIEVRNPQNRDVVEQQLQGLLKAFVVNNKQDCNTLEAIFKNKFPNAPKTIITSRFHKKVYDVSEGRVTAPPGTQLFMDEIKCSDPVIMNILIDRAQIETVLLTNSKSIAENITSHRENVPRNFQKVIVPKFSLEYYPEPHYRMYSLRITPARYIQVDIKERINQMEYEKESLQQQISELESEMTKLAPLLRKDLKLIDEKRQQLEQFELEKRDLDEKISDLENYEYPEYNEMDILKKELAETQRKLNDVQSKIDEKKNNLQDIESEKGNIESKYEEQKQAMQKIEQDISSIRAQADKITMEMRNFNDTFRNNEAKIQAIVTTIRQLESEKDDKTTALNAATQQAMDKGERIDSTRSKEELTDEIQTLKAKLKQREKITDDPEELKEMIQTKETRLENIVANYKNIEQSVHMLRASLVNRFNFIKKLKQHMVLILQFTFDAFLSLRNFSGTIDVDHHSKTLQVTVIPRDKHLNNAVSTTRALSGGERSYSTVAFLVSLWACVDHPFFFLDEYDVFTDEVNREYITRLLIKEGQRKLHRQYSYLTPQDMTIEASDLIKIHRLSVRNDR